MIRPDFERGVAGIRSLVAAKRKDVGRAETNTILTRNQQAALAAPDDADAEQIIMSSVRQLDVARDSGFISAQEHAAQRLAVFDKFSRDRLSLLPEGKQVELLEPSLGKEVDGWIGWVPIETRQALYDRARVAIRTEQRAQRAEQRLAMQSLVDDAKEIDRLASDGVAVPVDAFDSAIRNATEAGQGALAYRLKAGKIKAVASAEFRSSTPVELQDQINALDAEITNKGAKVEPGAVVLRDHLITLRDRASTELATDPLSWAAGAWGVEIPPLNWDDPRTLGERLKVSRLVSQRTGAPVKPLTDEEADEQRTDMAKGAGGQVAVMDRISRLGPQGAVAAARQLAPDNDLFRTAAALATTRIPMARALAIDALTGGEALKVSDTLFNDQIAKTYFSREIVPALRLMSPEMRKGVYEASRNIYAAHVTRAGGDNWEQKVWEDAVGYVLGGYKDANGVRLGGLGRYRGETIILPPGISNRDVENAMSRAGDEEFAAAGNGRPVWANGEPVPHFRLKQMHLVTQGDGVYRLVYGNGFVAKEGGGPFLLDLRKLRPRKGW